MEFARELGSANSAMFARGPAVDLLDVASGPREASSETSISATPPPREVELRFQTTRPTRSRRAFGQRTWNLSKPSIVFPIAGMPQPEAVGSPPDEVVLTPGDLLCVPWGWLHSTRPASARSVHLMLAYRERTAMDYLGWLLPQTRQRREVRSAAPSRRLRAGRPRSGRGHTGSPQCRKRYQVSRCAAGIEKRLRGRPRQGIN